MATGERWTYPKADPTPGRTCRDCGSASRPAPNPGPRCASCHRAAVKAASLRRKGARVQATYQLTPEAYRALYEAQAGRCAGCRRATGGSKRLAVDHDHTCCPGPTSCGQCVRGLLCDTCNRMLGHFRDSPESFERMAAYLRRSPTGWTSGRGSAGRQGVGWSHDDD